jgi:hypothetical protein
MKAGVLALLEGHASACLAGILARSFNGCKRASRGRTEQHYLVATGFFRLLKLAGVEFRETHVFLG